MVQCRGLSSPSLEHRGQEVREDADTAPGQDNPPKGGGVGGWGGKDLPCLQDSPAPINTLRETSPLGSFVLDQI